MTISATPRKAGPFTGDGAQTLFPFSFKVFQPSDLQVSISDGVNAETVLSPSAYTVTLNADQETSPGGQIFYNLPLGYRLTAVGNLPYDQPLDIPGGGNFSPVAIENELDRAIMQVQQLHEGLSRALVLPATSTASPLLPAPVAEKYIGWNTDGTALVNKDAPTGGGGGGTAEGAESRFDTFTGDGFTTGFFLSSAPLDLASVQVSVDGMVLVPLVDYTLSGSSVALVTAPTNGAEILVRYWRMAATPPAAEVYKFIADEGQLSFTLAGGYQNNTNSVAVYVNGLRMENGGVDFSEPTTTSITFASGLKAGDSVVCLVGTEPTGGTGPGTVLWDSIAGKPLTFPPSTHSHAITDITGLTGALAGKQASLSSGVNIKTINGNSLLGSGDLSLSGGGAATAAGVSFTSAGNVSATNVQAAIQELDNEKQVKLVSGTSIKTINGTTLLGGGDITISGSGTPLTDTAIAAALTANNSTKNWVWNSDIPGAANASSNSTIYLQRKADYTGGPAGVGSALYVDAFTPTGTHTTFEWALTAVCWSRSVRSTPGGVTSPQNVGINGSAFRTAGNAPIWAGNFAAYHLTDEYGPTKGEMHGIEVNVGGNGVDTGENTIGLFLAPQLRTDAAGPGVFSAWTGILVAGDSLANWRNGITVQAGTTFGYIDRGAHVVAFDLSTSTNSQAAIRIKANDWIAMEGTGSMKFRFNSSNGYLEFYNGSTRRGYINLGSGADVDLASGTGGGSAPANMVTTDTNQTITGAKTFTGGIGTSGIFCEGAIVLAADQTVWWQAGANVSTSASAGFASALPANPAGYLRVVIGGTYYKLPFFT